MSGMFIIAHVHANKVYLPSTWPIMKPLISMIFHWHSIITTEGVCGKKTLSLSDFIQLQEETAENCDIHSNFFLSYSLRASNYKTISVQRN